MKKKSRVEFVVFLAVVVASCLLCSCNKLSGFKKGGVYIAAGKFAAFNGFMFDEPDKGAVTIDMGYSDTTQYASYAVEGSSVIITYSNGKQYKFTSYGNYLIEDEATVTGGSGYVYSLQNYSINDTVIDGIWEYSYDPSIDDEVFSIEFNKDGTYDRYLGKEWDTIPQYESGGYLVEGDFVYLDDDAYLIYGDILVSASDVYTRIGK